MRVRFAAALGRSPASRQAPEGKTEACVALRHREIMPPAGLSRPDRFASGATAMPSLMRFLAGCAIVGVLGSAAVWALATRVEPNPREMTIRISQDRFEAK
jgi:hypothetical protein